MGLSRRRILAASAALAWALAHTPAAYAQATYSFDLPSQDLGRSLRTVARRIGSNIVFEPAAVRGRTAPVLRGSFSAQGAIEQLLAGSSLRAVRTSGGSWVISGDTPLSGEAEAGSAAADSGSAEADIIVVGTNIRGIYPSSSPVEIYTARDIERTAATTTEQFIRTLPQNTGTTSPFGGTSNAEEGASGIDLRGLGAGTTLTLVNGRRLSLASRGRTADISMIPASAIQRVEVLTDGASAIYGSDAIGGVVNFVLRDDFEGAETRLSFGGVTSGGLRQGNFTQTFGRQWGSGHGLISYDYFRASALDRTDRDYSAALAPGTLTPDDVRHSMLATFSQNLTDRLTVGGDILLGRRNIENATSIRAGSTNPLTFRLTTGSTDEAQVLANLALNYEISESLNASLQASYADSETDRTSITTFFNNPSAAPSSLQVENQHTGLDITARLDGALFSLPGGDLRFSLGAGLLDEDYSGQNDTNRITGSDIGRMTRYAFVELFAPLIGPDQNVPLVHRLELSLAARYTDIEDTSQPSIGRDFGSATDPKIGLLWAPVSGFNFRATYGTSFRAPSLPQLDPVSQSAVSVFLNFRIPSPSGTPSTLLFLSGVSPDIDSESAETYTFGIDLRPPSHPQFALSATYYNIDYTDRIAMPSFGQLPLQNPGAFPELITRQPPAAVIEAILRQSFSTSLDLSNPAATAAAFAANPNFWLYDLRSRNLAASQQEGIDFRIRYHFDTPWGAVRLGGSLSYIMRYEQALLAGQPTISVVNREDRPVDLRGRVYAGLSHGGFDGTLSVNYVDDYTNTVDPSGLTPIGSWTTVDLNFSYNFGRQRRNGFLNGLRVNVSVQNLFDQDPPFVVRAGADSRFGFDPVNANPLGRFVMVGIAKSW